MSSDSDSKKSNFTGILKLYPEYRKLWSAQAVNNIGNQFTFIALQFLVYNLTESTVAMGILAICQTISMITLGPYTLASVLMVNCIYWTFHHPPPDLLFFNL